MGEQMLIKLESDRLIVRKLKTYDLNDVFEYMSDKDTNMYFIEGIY